MDILPVLCNPLRLRVRLGLSSPPTGTERIMNRPDIGVPCAFPGDLSMNTHDAVIRWTNGYLYINGYRSGRVDPPNTLEGVGRAVLETGYDVVPPELVTPFAEEVIAQLGPTFILYGDDVLSWVERRERKFRINVQPTITGSL